MMMTIMCVIGLFFILLGISIIQEVLGVNGESTIIVKMWKGLCFIFSKIWGKTKKGAFPTAMIVVGLVSILVGVCVFAFVSFKLESDKERATGVLGMSRLDWQLVSREARKADGHRTTYERKWLGDKLEIQHSEMQRHVSDPESTLVRVYLPGPVDGSLFFEVSPNGETKEWTMPPTPPIFPKK